MKTPLEVLAELEARDRELNRETVRVMMPVILALSLLVGVGFGYLVAASLGGW